MGTKKYVFCMYSKTFDNNVVQTKTHDKIPTIYTGDIKL